MASPGAALEQEPTNQRNVEGIPSYALVPLRVIDLPRVLPYNHFSLADRGWTTVTFETPTDKLYASSQALLQASRAFFDLPTDYKQTFQSKFGSEEGWSHIPGEKQLITLRTLDHTPKELTDAASAYWAEAGAYLNELLGRIAESLDLPSNALTVYSDPCIQLGYEKTATMLRCFRYEGSQDRQSKIVAEAHKDLGLLSLVISDLPGLEVWNRYTQSWFPVERSFDEMSGSLLAGRQLERLSNGRYRAGGHLVRSYPDSSIGLSQFDPERPSQDFETPQNCRHSIVFVLRAHSPVLVNTDDLTTAITGQFNKPIKGIPAGELFTEIRRAHFNINTGIQERDDQRRKLAEMNDRSYSTGTKPSSEKET